LQEKIRNETLMAPVAIEKLLKKDEANAIV